VNATPLTEILGTLSDTMATSGDEIEMRRTLRPYLEGNVDEMRVDSMGNLLTVKKGIGKVPLKVLITAHMDEVGLMVVDHGKSGQLHVRSIGGLDPRLLPGLDVRVGEEQIPGVIGLQAIHRAKENAHKVTPLEKLTVDIGAQSDDEAKGLAPIGTRVMFATETHPLGDLIAGKAFDDRAGCTTLVGLLQAAPYPFDLHGVFTVQEEVGLRGARVAAYTVDPDVAFALEGTIADDLPKEEDVSPTSEIGKGPVITVMDRSYISDRRLLRYAVRLAEELEIPYQFKQPGVGGTDSGAIHLSRGGVPTLTVAVPCRYIHSPTALLHPKDLERTVTLMEALLRRLTPEVLERDYRSI
jgi:endoglucanase